MEKVLRIQRGQKTLQFERLKKTYGIADEKSLSIIYIDEQGQEQSLNLICPNREGFRYVYRALKAVVTHMEEERNNISLDKQYLKRIWDSADADFSGTLSRKEIINVIGKMNIQMSTATVESMFRKVDVDNNGSLSYTEFLQFMEILRRRPELEMLWGMIINNEILRTNFSKPMNIVNVDFVDKKQTISLNHFIQFWQDTQGELLSEPQAVVLLSKHSTDPVAFEQELVISNNMWTTLMTSQDNDTFIPSKLAVYQDMTRPLAHYFIASSHNTYLEGDQLMSNSSVQRYIDDLLSGCRCVELDCWDGDAGEPVIYHGHTLTSKIFFEDVVKAIMQYGFQKSPFPIILSIENHCSLPQQQRLAQIMKAEFGESLAMPMSADTAPPPGRNGFTPLPSPAALLNKVLVKGKRMGDAPDDDEDDEAEDAVEESVGSESPRAAALSSSKRKSSGTSFKRKSTAETKHEKVHPELSELTFLSTGKVNGFDTEGNLSIPADSMCSFSEGTTLKNLKNKSKVSGWVVHNAFHLSRIYPKGTRVDSSNYDPAPAWAAGSHLVALNYQTPDVAMHVNRGKFKENGDCGYVLKPEYMRGDSSFAVPSPPMKLTVTVLSASQLPKPRGAQKGEVIDPYIVLSVHGVSEDMIETRTKTIDDNGFNPVWNEVKEFTISNPDTAVLNFEVLEEDIGSSEFIAFCSLPVSCLMKGFRVCKLMDPHGRREHDFAFANLFVHIAIAPMPSSKL